jgi:hypothetical protein
MAERDPHELSEQLEREIEDLERHNREVKQAVDETHENWERKRRDESVPGARPPDAGEAGDPGTADEA